VWNAKSSFSNFNFIVRISLGKAELRQRLPFTFYTLLPCLCFRKCRTSAPKRERG
jgi:hypothetical protein